MNPMLNTAVQAARKAGRLITQSFDRIDTLTITEKAQNDFVTEVDKASENSIIETLRKSYPDHKIIAEESGVSDDGKDDFVWIIDPLDGTANFIHSLPHFAVSIALRYQGKLHQAVVYDPMRNELFTASRGNGAMLNDRKIRVSQSQHLKHALIGTGFPFRHPECFEEFLATFKTLFPQTGGMRRAGAAALDLAYVGTGRLDGYFEAKLQPWDIAAGALIVKEAGGLVGDFDGQESYLETGNIIAANSKIFKALLKNIKN